MNNNDKDFLGTAPIGKLLLSLALPTITAQLINMLYNIVDRIYIGHIPEAGALALTGVGVCMPLILIVSAFAALVGSGGAPRASILMGKQEHDQAEQILGNCFALLFLISIVLTVILLAWNRPILLAFGASENTIGYATDYMNIYAIGTIFVQMTLGMNMFITTQGYAKTGMLSVLIGYHRSCLQHHFGPDLYLRYGHGRKGRCTGNGDLPGGLLCLGHFLPLRKKDPTAVKGIQYEDEKVSHSSLYCPGRRYVCHAGQREYHFRLL